MSWTPPTWPERARTLLRAALDLSTTHDPDEVLERIVASAAQIAGARYAALGVYDREGNIGRFVHHGLDADTVAAIGELPKGRGLLGQVIVADHPIRLTDLSADPRSCGFPARHPPMHTFLGVPVARSGRRYGNLYLTEKRSGEAFDDEDEALVVTLAAFAAGAIEAIQLAAAEAELVAAGERDRRRQDVLAAVIAAQEGERARVSRDLHDDIGQALTSVLLGLKLFETSLGDNDVDDTRRRAGELRQLVADALARARGLAFDLRPTVLDDVGLPAALTRLADTVAERHPIRVNLAVNGVGESTRLDPDVETFVYRVVQEALTNVVRHAHATHASVLLALNAGRLRAVIEDDGVGFDTSIRPPGHLGLKGMDERAALAGGTVKITSDPGHGTTVVVEVRVG